MLAGYSAILELLEVAFCLGNPSMVLTRRGSELSIVQLTLKMLGKNEQTTFWNILHTFSFMQIVATLHEMSNHVLQNRFDTSYKLSP